MERKLITGLVSCRVTKHLRGTGKKKNIYIYIVSLSICVSSQSSYAITFGCTHIGDTSLDVSPACHYLSPSTLLLNVRGQTAVFWEKKKSVCRMLQPFPPLKCTNFMNCVRELSTTLYISTEYRNKSAFHGTLHSFI
jgi:hypothetical protein